MANIRSRMPKKFWPVAAAKLIRFAPYTVSIVSDRMSAVQPASFSVSKVTFSAVKSLESGGKQAYLNYDGKPLVMQVGPLETPFGMSVFDKAGPPKYSVDLKLRGYDDPSNNPTTATIYNALHGLDEFMLDQGVKNAVAWFKGSKSREVLSELYTPTVKFAKDAEGNLKPYPPTLKLQLRQRDGKFETIVYDDKKRPLSDVPLEDIIVKGTVMTALIQCTGVWFAGGKFGISWKALQIRADKIPSLIGKSYAFVDGDESDSVVVAPKAVSAAAAAPNRFAALHDEDEEIDDEEALAPTKVVPPPVEEEDEDGEAPVVIPPKKMIITKKKIVTAAVKKAV